MIGKETQINAKLKEEYASDTYCPSILMLARDCCAYIFKFIYQYIN